MDKVIGADTFAGGDQDKRNVHWKTDEKKNSRRITEQEQKYSLCGRI